jgi:hypothetical protein
MCGNELDKVRLTLILITLAITLGPIGGAAFMYISNPMSLIIPPNLGDILSGSIFPGGSTELTTFKGAVFDVASRKVSLTFNFANPFSFDMKINSMNASIECAFDNFPLGTAVLKNPVAVRTGETAPLTIEGTWTEAALNHFQTQTVHLSQTETDVNLLGLLIDMDGMTIQINDPIRVAHVPIQ